MNIGSFFSGMAHSIANWFGSHQSSIQVALHTAQSAAKDAVAVATVLGEPSSVTSVIGKISDGLGSVSSAVTAETSAASLNDHAANLTGLISDLVNSGDIGIKNSATKTAIGVTLQKVHGVVGALETAAAASVAPVATPAA